MQVIDEIYTQHPYFGARRMSKHLVPFGITIGRKAVSCYYRIMAIEAIYPKMNLSKRNQAHKIYPYLLKGVEIIKVNQVWSTDITYIRMAQGFVYLVAIIDSPFGGTNLHLPDGEALACHVRHDALAS